MKLYVVTYVEINSYTDASIRVRNEVATTMQDAIDRARMFKNIVVTKVKQNKGDLNTITFRDDLVEGSDLNGLEFKVCINEVEL